jgi:ABC-2 type transport system permease protein
VTDAAVPAPLDAPVPAPPSEREAPALPADPTTRVIGGVWFAVFAACGFVVVRRVLDLDFGTENPRVLLLIRLAAFVVPGYPALLGLYALGTGRRPAQAYDPFELPLEGWWYATLATLTWRELKRFFFHPVLYVVFAVFLVFNGVLLQLVLAHYSDLQRAAADPASFYITTHTFMWLALVMLCPAITMRLLAEEQRLGTLEMLLTAPVTNLQVVLSKFVAAMAYFVAMIATTAAYQVILAQFTSEWEWGPVLLGYVGVVLGGCVFISIGLFFSSVTRSQILAYVLTLCVLFVMVLFVPFAAQMNAFATVEEWIRAVARHVNVLHHQGEMARGLLSFTSLTFYCTTTIFFLFLAVRGVESHRWR